MRIFSTRHGQVLPRRFFGGNADFPVGDEPLMPLGREQAKILGGRLREMGFSGVIYTSPYGRTLETAAIIARELGIGFTPLPCLREMFVTTNESADFVGFTGEEIKELYPEAVLPEDFPYPWWERKDDTLDEVIERLKSGLEPVLKALPRDSDVLLVGHAATVVGLREVFFPEEYRSSVHWNCCINLLYSSSGESYAHDVSHIPAEILTANYMWYRDKRAEYEDSLKRGEEFFSQNKGERVLHIGDTHSANYKYFREMIEKFKPDVIIHTGDLADEKKAGRVEVDKARWAKTVPTLLDAMRASGARLILVPGNNDLEDELTRLAPDFEIYPRNTVLEFSGKKLCLNHEVLKIAPEIKADVHLYGHGLTGEERKADDNIRDGVRYFNATWGVSLHDFVRDEHLVLPKIEL